MFLHYTLVYSHTFFIKLNYCSWTAQGSTKLLKATSEHVVRQTTAWQVFDLKLLRTCIKVFTMVGSSLHNESESALLAVHVGNV